MAKSNLRLVTPTTENRTVIPQRPPNAELRTREHLTADEVEKLIEAAKQNRHGHRDALMALLAYRHGLRAAEVVDLPWEQVDFKTATLHIRRAKNGTPATHPLSGREMRELRRHQRESAQSLFVFVSERGAPLTAPGFSRMIERAAMAANLGIKAHATCCAMPVAISLPTTGTTRVRSRPTSGIATFRIRRAIPLWRPSGSRNFFGIESAEDQGSCRRMAALLFAEFPGARELDTDFMVALPDHPALPASLRPSGQMEHEALRKIINVVNRQARTFITHVDQGAAFKNAVRCPLDPSGLIDRSPKEQTPIEEIRAHGGSDRR
jgi:hypothetical protein